MSYLTSRNDLVTEATDVASVRKGRRDIVLLEHVIFVEPLQYLTRQSTVFIYLISSFTNHNLKVKDTAMTIRFSKRTQ